jgi:hypothetical protein
MPYFITPHNMTRLMKQHQASGSKQRGLIIMFALLILGLITLLFARAAPNIIPNSEEVSTRVANYISPTPQESSFRHDNLNLQPEKECTEQQREKINVQLNLESGNVQVQGCNDPNWLDSFFEEEADIGTESFLGISVGCNKVCVCSSSHLE